MHILIKKSEIEILWAIVKSICIYVLNFELDNFVTSNGPFSLSTKLVRGTAIFLSTEYGIRRVPYFKGTKSGTGYGDFQKYGVRGVRGTKGTVFQGYGIRYRVR